MKTPDLPANEAQRLANLDRLGILYTPAEERFDRITRIAQRLFNVPIALVSLVGENTQWSKSSQGIAETETPRHLSFCAHAILRKEPMVIQDASKDPSFADNPLVKSGPRVRFYAGCPLEYDGTPLGTLCVIDMLPRKFKPSDVDSLKSLGAWAESELKISRMSEAQLALLAKLDESKRGTMTDPVTRLWNRTGIEDLLETEFARAQRQDTPMAILLIEVADFESIAKGADGTNADQLLREASQRIRSCVRPHDLVGRLDDHDFLVFLGDCNAAHAKVIANRVAARIADEAFDLGDDRFRVRVNIGASASKNVSKLTLRKLRDSAASAIRESRALNQPGVTLKSVN